MAVMIIDFAIPASVSLKSKRKITKSVIDRIKNKFNVSIAEIAHLDKWQRCTIGVAMIGNNRNLIKKSYNSIEQLVKENAEIDLLDVTLEWM
jgi:uncharacterized protein YlxP (DUF503 family)